MNTAAAESALQDLRAALEAGRPEEAFMTCAKALEALINLCYEAEGLPLPPLEERFEHLPETRLGTRFRPNIEAYARVCRRLDGVTPSRSPDTFPQYSDGVRLLARLRAE
ncbi:MAG TPA: hypothetical protein IAC82_02655 [Candidatus Merdivicinus intestinigallinarum]|nr:hypothetical protein [Candidatus Merdivicinus intestinigallinarum]